MDVGAADSKPGRINRGATSGPGGPDLILRRRTQDEFFSSERMEIGKEESNERGP